MAYNNVSQIDFDKETDTLTIHYGTSSTTTVDLTGGATLTFNNDDLTVDLNAVIDPNDVELSMVITKPNLLSIVISKLGSDQDWFATVIGESDVRDGKISGGEDNTYTITMDAPLSLQSSGNDQTGKVELRKEDV